MRQSPGALVLECAAVRLPTPPDDLTQDERRQEVVTLLALGLRRLRIRNALDTDPPFENLSNSGIHRLEPVPPNPLTVPVG